MHPNILKYINNTCEAHVCYGAPEQNMVSTGIPVLDAATGGIPTGQIVEIYGHEGSGKTALALQIAQGIGGPILYADADCGLSPYILGGRDVYLLRAGTLENTLNACRIAIAGGFRCIVIDTVAALPTNEDLLIWINCKYSDVINTQARVMSKALPILSSILYRNGCTLILVNQLRERYGVLYGNPTYSTGGKAIGYYASLRLETRKIEDLKSRNGEFIGRKIIARVSKNKYAPPGRRAEINLMYDGGMNS